MSLYTPERSIFASGLTLANVAGITGKYTREYQLPAGVTLGQWYGISAGITAYATLRADVFPFDVVDFAEEPNWLSVSDFREYSALEDDDHTRDIFYKRLVATAIKLIEARTRRSWRVRNFSEIINLSDTSKILLKNYPVVSIAGLTGSIGYTPNTTVDANLPITSTTPIYYRLDHDSGVMTLTDSSGYGTTYDNITLFITYAAGYATIPEAIRTAALVLASQLLNLSTSEGIDSLRLSDLNFALNKNLFEGTVSDLLNDYVKRDF